MCACQKSYTPMIMTSITWAGPRCVQEAAAILGPQNRTQGRCDTLNISTDCSTFNQRAGVGAGRGAVSQYGPHFLVVPRVPPPPISHMSAPLLSTVLFCRAAHRFLPPSWAWLWWSLSQQSCNLYSRSSPQSSCLASTSTWIGQIEEIVLQNI